MAEKRKKTPIEGKVRVLYVAIFCSFFSFVLLLIAFSTPSWLQSWPRVHSGFKRLGLWEACFAGLVLPRDPSQKAYHGCWWILAKEYWDIRGWIMPGWFIACQIFATVCLVGTLIAFVLNVVVRLRLNDRKRFNTTNVSHDDTMYKQKRRRDPIVLLITSTILVVICMVLMMITSVVFGVMYKVDRTWMPHPHLNYLSWSYGLAVVSTFFLIFGCIAQVTYTMIEIQDRKEPLRAPALPVKDSKV